MYTRESLMPTPRPTEKHLLVSCVLFWYFLKILLQVQMIMHRKDLSWVSFLESAGGSKEAQGSWGLFYHPS